MHNKHYIVLYALLICFLCVCCACQVEEDVGLILQKIYKGTTPSKNDWCTMITPAGDTVWYNKRTGTQHYTTDTHTNNRRHRDITGLAQMRAITATRPSRDPCRIIT